MYNTFLLCAGYAFGMQDLLEIEEDRRAEVSVEVLNWVVKHLIGHREQDVCLALRDDLVALGHAIVACGLDGPLS